MCLTAESGQPMTFVTATCLRSWLDPLATPAGGLLPVRTTSGSWSKRRVGSQDGPCVQEAFAQDDVSSGGWPDLSASEEPGERWARVSGPL